LSTSGAGGNVDAVIYSHPDLLKDDGSEQFPVPFEVEYACQCLGDFPKGTQDSLTFRNLNYIFFLERTLPWLTNPARNVEIP